MGVVQTFGTLPESHLLFESEDSVFEREAGVNHWHSMDFINPDSPGFIQLIIKAMEDRQGINKNGGTSINILATGETFAPFPRQFDYHR